MSPIAAAVSAWFSSVPLRLVRFDSNQVHTLASSDSLQFQKMVHKFHVKVVDLQATPAETIAKEVLVVYVLRPRVGIAGSAQTPGEHTAKANDILKEGQIYKKLQLCHCI